MLEPTDAARVTALWLARIAREAGGLCLEPTDTARVTGPWLARIATGRRSCGAPGCAARVTGPWLARISAGRRRSAGLAAARMCLRPSALTWAVGKRGRQSRDAQRQSEATFTLYAGRFFARLDAGSVGALRGRGAGKKRAAVKGRAAAKRSDVYPLRRILFCETGSGQRWE